MGGAGGPPSEEGQQASCRGVWLPPPSASCIAWQSRAREEAGAEGGGAGATVQSDRKQARGLLRSDGARSEGRQGRGSVYRTARPPTEGSPRGSEASGCARGARRGQRAEAGRR